MGVYNSISNVRRIAFIDGLNDENAKSLSIKYPFAICYASLPSENENDNIKWLPGFWKAGERYGIQNIDENPVTLNGFTIKLTLDKTTGTLKLISHESTIEVRSITINPKTTQLNVGQVYPLSVSFVPSNASNKSVTWTSSDESKVSVSNSGVIIAKQSTNPGEEVIIQATSDDDSNITDTCLVTVINYEPLYYIGSYQDQFAQGSSIYINNSHIAESVGSSGWHKVNDQLTKTDNFYTYEGGGYNDGENYDVIVIPSEYSFGLPLFDNESHLRLMDIGFINSANQPYDITVNNNTYKVYKFESSISKFVNSILPKNQLLDPTQ